MPRTLSSIQERQIQRCAKHAFGVLDWVLSLGPVKKDQLRYAPDSALALMSFCCLFLMAAIRTFPSCISSPAGCVERVKCFAELMADLAVGTNSSAHIYGSLILTRVTVLQEFLHHQENVVGDHPMHFNSGGVESLASDRPSNLATIIGSDSEHDESCVVNDNFFWDFSCLIGESE